MLRFSGIDPKSAMTFTKASCNLPDTVNTKAFWRQQTATVSVLAASVATSSKAELDSALHESCDYWMTVKQLCLELVREVVQLSPLSA